MSDDALPTYEGVARWLPRAVRTAIEVTRPCVTGEPHDWEHRQFAIFSFDGSGGNIHHWQCLGCGLDTSADPAKVA